MYLIIFSRSINRHKGDYGRPTAAISRDEHNVLYAKKHRYCIVLYIIITLGKKLNHGPHTCLARARLLQGAEISN